MEGWSWEFFTPDEVLSSDGMRFFEETGICLVRPDALDKLNNFRRDLGVPVYCNHGNLQLRGYRSQKEQFSIPGSAKRSQHVQGCAFDISCPDVPPVDLYEQALDFGWTGVGLYDSFVHVDVRNRPDGRVMVWDNRRG